MPTRNPIDHTTMREMNITLILDSIRLHKPISRAALAGRTGLNKASVSNMVKYLIATGYVRELGIDDSPSDVGRPAINLQLNPAAGYIISAEIGVNFISIIVTDFQFEIVARRYESIPPGGSQQETLAFFAELMVSVYTQISASGRPIFGLAVGLPGLVDMHSGQLLYAPNLDWRDAAIRDYLKPHFDIPIIVANEANMAAFGESYFGVGQHSRLLLFISSGVGLGGGIVINGQLLTGANGLAGEFGHMTIDAEGPLCRCGNHGCWETRASQTALVRRVRDAIASGRRSTLSPYRDQLSVNLVVDAARSGDVVAAEALAETGRWLGIGIASLINALSPEHLVFGGTMSLAYDMLLPTMRTEIEQRALHWIWDNVTLSTATYSADATVMGGIAMIHRHVINHPMSWKWQAEAISK